MSTGTASLTGNTLNNFLNVGTGNNAISGGEASTLFLLLRRHASLLTGKVTGSGTDTLSSIERLYGSDNADKLTGDANANYLHGYAGNDTLDGGAGTDTMVGGDGNDIYYVRDSGDLVSETNATASTGGTDTVYSYLSSYTLGISVEYGRIMSTARTASLTGNTLNNFLNAGTGGAWFPAGV